MKKTVKFRVFHPGASIDHNNTFSVGSLHYSQLQDQMDTYSPSRIIAAADAKVVEGDIQGAEMLYKEALLDWVDDAREGTAMNQPDKMKNAIADLWCGYATFYFKLKKVNDDET